jgi:hypothetical protein
VSLVYCVVIDAPPSLCVCIGVFVVHRCGRPGDTRLLCGDIDGRPAYVYILHMPLPDAYRRSRKGCAPLPAAVFVISAADTEQLRFFFETLLACVLAASGTGLFRARLSYLS